METIDLTQKIDPQNNYVFDILIPWVQGNEFKFHGRFCVPKEDSSKYTLWARNSFGDEWELNCLPYSRYDKRDGNKDIVLYGYEINESFAIIDGVKVSFFLKSDSGEERSISPLFTGRSGIHEYLKKSYESMGDFLVKLRSGILSFEKKTLVKSLIAEMEYVFEETAYWGVKAPIWWMKRINERQIRKIALTSSLLNQVAFISTREDKLEANMKAVFDKAKSPKKSLAKANLYRRPLARLYGAKLVYTSKVVVTDDSLFYIRRYGKKENQKLVQLWHAAGAFKSFGLDDVNVDPGVESLYHRDYDLVTVSSDDVRPLYAGAFNIDESKVKALGVARTDEFFQNNEKEIAERVFGKYPNLRNKEIIVYAPTFRDLQDRDRSIFKPDLDFEELSNTLLDNQVFVICPHPVMSASILKSQMPKVMEIRDFSSNDLMRIASLLITDYSSVIFEYALLNKPIAFFCYDYDTYERNFYIDYERELPGVILKNQQQLLEYIKNGDFYVDKSMGAFVKKYMSACDGHSAERIAEELEQLIKV